MFKRRKGIRASDEERPGLGWLVVDDSAHLFLNPGPHPVCKAPIVADATTPRFVFGDPVCEGCDTYLREVYLVQVG